VMRYVRRLGLLVLFFLALSACGGGSADKEAKAHELPESSLETGAKRIPAGSYVSDEFRAAISFRLDEGWQTGSDPDYSYGDFLETSNNITLSIYSKSGTSFLEFLIVPKVYKVVSSYEAKAEPTPKDLLSWLQNNPNLDAEKPEPVSIGGVKGQRFDAVASRIPQEYIGRGYHAGCSEEPCLPLFQVIPAFGEESTYELYKNDKVRFIVLNDINGKTVTIAVLAPTVKFDEFWPKVQRVLKTVEWKDM
jgi:hypothetical protein